MPEARLGTINQSGGRCRGNLEEPAGQRCLPGGRHDGNRPRRHGRLPGHLHRRLTMDRRLQTPFAPP